MTARSTRPVWHPTRRQVTAGLAALPCLSLPAVSPALAAANARLREAARPLGIEIGTAINYIHPPSADYLALVGRECTVVSPENAGKWKWIEPTPGEAEWTAMDDTVDFARRHGMKINWHTLMWQNGGMPDFMKLPEEARPGDHPSYDPYYSPDGTISSDNYWERYQAFTAAVAERYGDIFFRVDAVNEAFLHRGSWLPDDLISPEGIRKGNWWHVAGGDEGVEWMDRFFEDARQRFPTAHLVINEFGIESVHSQKREKRAALLAWIEGAMERGVPLDGVGLQSHLVARESYDESSMAAFARRMQELGLKLFITEMDVDTRGLPEEMSAAQRNERAAEMAASHVRTMLENGDLREVTWWGLSSAVSFLTKRGGPAEALEPTLFDADLEPLPMYDAVAQVLESAA